MNSKLILKAIVGSRAYGTNIETSDTDYKGIYKQYNSDILGVKYKDQYELGKDETYYEIRRFLELCQQANPNILELLYVSDDCIIIDSPEYYKIREHRNKFLTKRCLQSFGGYAVQQIKKAKGLNKKMNWEIDRIERKSPLDFMYTIYPGTSLSMGVKSYWYHKFGDDIDIQKFQSKIGLQKLNHMPNMYAAYYDWTNEHEFHGILGKNDDNICLSSIPKHLSPDMIIHYNLDGFKEHCKDYSQYQIWLNERNENRYVDTSIHNQKIDGKNLMHCRRLIDMAKEIALTGQITVRRPNVDYLLEIRRGKIDLQTIIDETENDIILLDELYKNSNLPDTCDTEFINNLLIELRNE